MDYQADQLGKKVILVGGFGESPALRSRLRRVLAEEKNIRQHEIDFLTPDAGYFPIPIIRPHYTEPQTVQLL